MAAARLEFPPIVELLNLITESYAVREGEREREKESEGGKADSARWRA